MSKWLPGAAFILAATIVMSVGCNASSRRFFRNIPALDLAERTGALSGHTLRALALY